MAANKIDLSDFPSKWSNYLVDRLPEPHGFVRVRRYHPKLDAWKLVMPWDRNLVVNAGRDAISDQLGGIVSVDDAGPITPAAWTTLAEAQQSTVTRALVGSGGHGNPGPGDPFPPGLTDVDLNTFDYERPISATTRPSAISVGFQFTIPAAGPNTPFSEFGLGTLGDGTNSTWTPPPGDYSHRLVAKKTFGLITKIAGWEYQITWIIVF